MWARKCRSHRAGVTDMEDFEKPSEPALVFLGPVVYTVKTIRFFFCKRKQTVEAMIPLTSNLR